MMLLLFVYVVLVFMVHSIWPDVFKDDDDV